MRFLTPVLVSLSLLTMSTAPVAPPSGSFNPADTVVVGKQIWMAHNLAVNMPNSFWYERDSVTNKADGMLYFFSSAMAACPEGWHIPTDEDWQLLVNTLGGDSLASIALQPGGSSRMNLTLPGYRSANSPYDLFGAKGQTGYYWTSTVKAEQYAYARSLTKGKYSVESQYYRRANAFSVRFIKDTPAK